MAETEEVDFELIAAFIDGRLTGAERERVIKLLRDSEVAFETYADALRVRADLRDDGVTSITEVPRPRVSRWRVATPFAAAALLMIAVLPTIQARRNRANFDAPVASIISPLITGQANVSTALGPTWDHRDWAVYRGGTAVVESTTAFRLGVRSTDLHIALASNDRERAGRLIGEMQDLLQPVPLSDAVRAGFGEIRDELASAQTTPAIVAQSEQAEQDLADFLGPGAFSLGKWFAAAEVAARAQSAAFFSSPKTARFLDSAIDNGSLAPADVEVLRQVKSIADQGVTDEEFETIRQRFAELIRRHGG